MTTPNDEKPQIKDPAKHMVARRFSYFFAGVICLILCATFALAIYGNTEIVNNLGQVASIIITAILGSFGVIGTYLGTTNWPSKLM